MKMSTCPACMKPFDLHDCAESGIYAPGTDAILICNSCFDIEDALIEIVGTNDIPKTLEYYRNNLRIIRKQA